MSFYKVTDFTEEAMSSDVNQYSDAFAGLNDINISLFAPLAPPAAPTVALNGSGVLTGAYEYVVAFVTGYEQLTLASPNAYGTPIVYVKGQTAPGATAAITTASNSVLVSGIPTGPTGTVYRVLGRTVSGGSGTYYLLTTITDNVTTTYVDNTADSGLGAALSTTNTTGGVATLPAGVAMNELATNIIGSTADVNSAYNAFGGLTIATSATFPNYLNALQIFEGGGTSSKSVFMVGPGGLVTTTLNTLDDGTHGNMVAYGSLIVADNAQSGSSFSGPLRIDSNFTVAPGYTLTNDGTWAGTLIPNTMLAGPLANSVTAGTGITVSNPTGVGASTVSVDEASSLDWTTLETFSAGLQTGWTAYTAVPSFNGGWGDWGVVQRYNLNGDTTGGGSYGQVIASNMYYDSVPSGQWGATTTGYTWVWLDQYTIPVAWLLTQGGVELIGGGTQTAPTSQPYVFTPSTLFSITNDGVATFTGPYANDGVHITATTGGASIFLDQASAGNNAAIIMQTVGSNDWEMGELGILGAHNWGLYDFSTSQTTLRVDQGATNTLLYLHNTNAVTSLNNTLDDGTGNLTAAKAITAGTALLTDNGGRLEIIGLNPPTGLTAAVQTSGTVGTYLAANTTYYYIVTAIDHNGHETDAPYLFFGVSAAEGATAYPIALTWTAVTNAAGYSVYKGTTNNDADLYYLAGSTTNSYTDTGNTATTTQTSPAWNQSGDLHWHNLITGGAHVYLDSYAGSTNLDFLIDSYGGNYIWMINNSIGTSRLGILAPVGGSSTTGSAGALELFGTGTTTSQGLVNQPTNIVLNGETGDGTFIGTVTAGIFTSGGDTAVNVPTGYSGYLQYNGANIAAWGADVFEIFASNGDVTAEFFIDGSQFQLPGGNDFVISNLGLPSSFTATTATSGTVGSNLAASTTYTYGISANSLGGWETALLLLATATEGTTAYPINLSWAAAGGAVTAYNIYRATGDYGTNVSGFYANAGFLLTTTSLSAVDSGSVAPTTRLPIPADDTARIIGPSSLTLVSSQGDQFNLMQDYRDDGHSFRINQYVASTNTWGYNTINFSPSAITVHADFVTTNTTTLQNATVTGLATFNGGATIPAGQTFTNNGTWTGTAIPNAMLAGNLVDSITGNNGITVTNPTGVGSATLGLSGLANTVLSGPLVSGITAGTGITTTAVTGIEASTVSVNEAAALTWTALETFNGGINVGTSAKIGTAGTPFLLTYAGFQASPNYGMGALVAYADGLGIQGSTNYSADTNSIFTVWSNDEFEYFMVQNQGIVTTTSNTLDDGSGHATVVSLAAQTFAGTNGAARFVGGMSFGPPTSGTFAVGDFVVSDRGEIWVCTVAGTPGTWTSVNAPEYQGILNAMEWGASGSVASTTGAITAGSTALTLAAAQDFLEGQGIAIYGAGPAPSGTAANPAAAPIIINYFDNSSAVGITAGTTYYMAYAWQTPTGTTLPSPAATIDVTTGNNSVALQIPASGVIPFGASGIVIYTGTSATSLYELGYWQWNGTNNLGWPNFSLAGYYDSIYSFDISAAAGRIPVTANIGEVVTSGTAAPTTSTASLDPSVSATVNGTAGTTTYKYWVCPVDWRGGLYLPSAVSVTVTTGNATLSSSNNIALTWTVQNVAAFAIYGDPSNPSSSQGLLAYIPDITWTDTGAGAMTPPAHLPSTLPSASLGDCLITTVAVAGGADLTLATAATTTVSAGYVCHDDTAAIQAMIDHGHNVSPFTIVFPNYQYNTYVFNQEVYLDTSNQNTAISGVTLAIVVLVVELI